jgi:uncharacterized protein YjbJ (UPF0337 family)
MHSSRQGANRYEFQIGQQALVVRDRQVGQKAVLFGTVRRVHGNGFTSGLAAGVKGKTTAPGQVNEISTKSWEHMCANQHNPDFARQRPLPSLRLAGYVSHRTDPGSGDSDNRYMVCVILAPVVDVYPVDASPVDAYPIKQRWEMEMNRDQVEGNWKQFSGKLREQWGKLTRDDLGMNAGKRDQLAGSIQVRHGISKEESERQVRDFLYRNRDWDLSRRGFRP